VAVIERSGPAIPRVVQGGPSAEYVARGRDLRIDFLRGLCVIGMIVDHVGGASWLYAITGGNRFYTSAAEGFVFVSGLVAGRAYTRFIERDGLGYGLGRLVNRAGQLYLLAVGLALVVVPVSEVLHLPWALGWNLHDALDFVVSVVTLHRTYYLVDVMSLYVLVLLTSTLVFVLLVRGQTLLVLGGSWLLWLLYQVFPEHAAMPWPIVGNNLFYFSAWQVLFFTGVVIGHQWERAPDTPGESRLAKVAGLLGRDVWRRRVLRVTAVLLAVAILVYALQDRVLGFVFRDTPDRELLQAQLLTSIFGKSDLRWGRVLAFGLVFVVFFLATTEWWTGLRRWAGWLVVPLGQNALFAYAAHVLIALAVAYELGLRGGIDATPAWQNAALQIASVGLIWGIVQLRLLRAVFSVPSVRLATPAVLGVAALVVLPRIEFEGGQSLRSTGSPNAADSASAAAQIARAYGTAIPANTEPTLSAAVSAPPVPQGGEASTPPGAQAPPGRQGASTGAPPMSSAAGKLQGTLLEPEFFSPALNTKERYFVYLPPEQRGKRLPVLYMLHGGGGRHEWINYDLIGIADRAIAAGTLPPMLIVLPQGDQGYWVNHVDGPRWGDYLAQDLVQHIDATYPTLADPKHRAIGGLSMGGWGALYQAFSHPDEFGVVGAHAPSIRAGDGSMPFLPRGDGFNQFDPMALANNAPGIENLRVWLDADEQDPWLSRDMDLHTRLDKRHVANGWHSYPGRHGDTYWHDHAQDYLRFYGQALASP
jgi:enterochelin esterase-like enzyme